MCILLAEDEYLIRAIAKEWLEDAGHEVVAVANGQEAIGYLDRYPGRFVCLMTDYHMPQAHGGQVIEHLREIAPSTPAILASAYPHVITTEWRLYHRVHLLLKPYPLGDLVGLVERLLH